MVPLFLLSRRRIVVPRSLFTTIVANGFEFERENFVRRTNEEKRRREGEGGREGGRRRNENRSSRFESSGVSGNEVKLM